MVREGPSGIRASFGVIAGAGFALGFFDDGWVCNLVPAV